MTIRRAVTSLALALALPAFSSPQEQLLAFSTSAYNSLNVSSCPGYELQTLKHTDHGLTARLKLAGTPCDAFSADIANLSVEVTYETQSRLHVHMFDTASRQFTLPPEYFDRPAPPTHTSSALKNTSDLEFNYDPAPFAFWITRRSDPAAPPLFDTRTASLPPAPIAPFINASDNRTAFDGFALVFEQQYLQLTSALPYDANVYGLGEAVSSSGFRRQVIANGTIQTGWARDAADPENENIYGAHSVYLEHRFNSTSNTSQSHGVFLNNAAGSDILLATPPGSNTSIVQYRMLGGTLDLYFLSGPDPKAVVEQYGEVVGLPAWQPLWGFGFHLCRWGYENLSETKLQVQRMRDANIPLEVMWNDIDLYHSLRDFTSDPVSFPGDEMRTFIRELAANGQHYIPILDAAIGHIANSSDVYDPFTRGIELDVFVKNPDNSTYIGQVWPGYTVFPDWFGENTDKWWLEALGNWSNSGVEFSGLWLDMNEISSFCEGSCGTGADLSNTSVPVLLPGDPGSLVTEYPEGYNSTISGPSGNVTVNGTLTYGAGQNTSSDTFVPSTLLKRGLGAAGEPGVDLNVPPYAIHNGFGKLAVHTLAPNATHHGGYVELDTHNVWGYMEERATNLALRKLRPGARPFLIARSTFPGSGKWSGHWLGDNLSKWAYLHFSIQGVLQFQLFQIPMVGADACGFEGNTDEELCNRWMQLAAFTPFYRNHNQRSALSQEPYRWDSVANASRTAIATRYSLLPYWYTLFANASTRGTPPVRALFFEFPDEPALFDVDRQFLIGTDILVTPVLTPNVSTVDGLFPGRGNVIWRDWYTHEAVNTTGDGVVTLAAPLGHIPVHVRSGAAILLHSQPGYTTRETAQSPYALLVSLDADGSARGSAYVDDGATLPEDGAGVRNRTLQLDVQNGRLLVKGAGAFEIAQRLEQVTVLGAPRAPSSVTANGRHVPAASWVYTPSVQRLVLSHLGVDLNDPVTVSWQ
ncbi:glycoside hydrolase family 31 protein [Auriscalpium vulgare]|uniref:Glycoside hydrolase family 31 protein n=1 Tax=Auriscalpium vulgare TaxID=40419 RepID=A0ACB8R8W6_9AGAM|nr:glycoside hydrolase family 31 protein [Auriscalpium vulgare]